MTSTTLTQRPTAIAAAIVERLGLGRSSRPLPRLADAHPRATGAPRRWRGVGTIPVAAIVGTAAMAAGTRRTDFLPTAGHAPAGWKLRWERLNDASRNQISLPPITAVKADDGYWVLDGHNRVALARASGQEWIDAEVTEVVLSAAHQSRHSIALKEA
jgi:hypothetical protein